MSNQITIPRTRLASLAGVPADSTPQQISAALTPRAVTRKDFTDRLGLPEDASNDQVLAAFDRQRAAKQRRDLQNLADAETRRIARHDDEAYAAIYGPRPASQVTPVDLDEATKTDRELYAEIYGGVSL